MVNFLQIFEGIFCCCFVVAVCDLMHDLESIHGNTF